MSSHSFVTTKLYSKFYRYNKLRNHWKIRVSFQKGDLQTQEASCSINSFNSMPVSLMKYALGRIKETPVKEKNKTTTKTKIEISFADLNIECAV